MCRWAAYLGQDIYLSDVLVAPAHSLIAQSRAASECKTATNADGFGIAWYGDRPDPGLFRDVLPAWSDPNLQSLAHQVKSGLFLAHVRASTGTATSRNNCHPFVCGGLSFMHNGQIGGFDALRKSADMLIPDALYGDRKGATDSEALFLVAVGMGLQTAPLAAMEQAVATFEHLSKTHGAAPHIRLAAAFSDGKRLFAVRYSSDAIAPTLYYRWSESRRGWAVVSEPLEQESGWIEVPAGSFCVFEGENVEIQPFRPILQYSDPVGD